MRSRSGTQRRYSRVRVIFESEKNQPPVGSYFPESYVRTLRHPLRSLSLKLFFLPHTASEGYPLLYASATVFAAGFKFDRCSSMASFSTGKGPASRRVGVMQFRASRTERKVFESLLLLVVVGEVPSLTSFSCLLSQIFFCSLKEDVIGALFQLLPACLAEWVQAPCVFVVVLVLLLGKL